jgi:hypothetical protein
MGVNLFLWLRGNSVVFSRTAMRLCFTDIASAMGLSGLGWGSAAGWLLVEVIFRHGFAVQFNKSDCWAAPIVFGPRTLWRTWGTRPISFDSFVTQTSLFGEGLNAGKRCAGRDFFVTVRS